MIVDIVNNIINNFTTFANKVLFFNITFNDKFNFPALVAWLVCFGVYFLIKFDFMPLRLLFKSVKLGFSAKLSKQQKSADNPYNLSSSKMILLAAIGEAIDVSAIFGVTMAVMIAGPGVLFWMLIGCIVGMPLRFVEVSLGCITRKFDKKTKTVRGGPQVYIPIVFRAIGFRKLGIFIAKMFAFCVIISTFFSLQINQTSGVIKYIMPELSDHIMAISIVLSTFVVCVVRLGFSTIIKISGALVRIMSILYIIIAMIIIFCNASKLLPAISLIVSDAFTFRSISGSVLFSFILGLRRTFFSCDIGQGVSSLIHINTINKNPIQEGVISMSAVVFITFVAIFCSGMIAIVTESYIKYNEPMHAVIFSFSTIHPMIKYALFVLIPMFAITTAAAWGYFGSKSWNFLFSTDKFNFVYYILLFCAYIMSCIVDFGKIINLADIFNMSIAIPNLITLAIGAKFVYRRIKKRKFEV